VWALHSSLAPFGRRRAERRRSREIENAHLASGRVRVSTPSGGAVRPTTAHSGRVGRLGSRSRALRLAPFLICSQGVGALLGLLTARWLGPSAKGVVTAFATWAQLIGWIAGLGLGTAFQLRAVHIRGERELLGRMLGNALVFSVTVGLTTSLIALPLLSRSLRHLSPDAPYIASLLLLPIAFNMLTGFLALIQLALQRTGLYGTTLLISPIVTGILAIGFRAFHYLNPVSLSFAYAVGSLASFATAAAHLPWRLSRPHMPSLLHDLRFGVKTWLGSVLGLANLRLDLLLLSTFLGSAKIGIYAAATNLLIPIGVLPAVVSLLILPEVASAATSREGYGLIRRRAALTVKVSSVTAIVICLLCPVVIPALLGPAYRPAIPLVLILAPGLVARAYANVLIAGSTGLKKTKVGNAAETAGLLFTIVLLVALVPTLGILGASFASSASYTASALTAFVLTRDKGQAAHHDTEVPVA